MTLNESIVLKMIADHLEAASQLLANAVTPATFEQIKTQAHAEKMALKDIGRVGEIVRGYVDEAQF